MGWAPGHGRFIRRRYGRLCVHLSDYVDPQLFPSLVKWKTRLHFLIWKYSYLTDLNLITTVVAVFLVIYAMSYVMYIKVFSH